MLGLYNQGGIVLAPALQSTPEHTIFEFNIPGKSLIMNLKGCQIRTHQ
jgi:hypothetical protein